MSKWIPKNETIGVPGEGNEPGGFIKASDFKEEHLKQLVDRANNRGIDVDDFLLTQLRRALPADGDTGIDDSTAKKDSPLDVEILQDEAKSGKGKKKVKDEDDQA